MNVTKNKTYMALGGGAGKHTQRQVEDQSCMGQGGHHFGLLLGGCHQGVVGKQRMAGCRFQEDLEADRGRHYTPGEDMAPWLVVVGKGAPGRWAVSTWRCRTS